MSEKESIDLVHPPVSVSSNAHIGNMHAYLEQYKRSIEEPSDYWGEIAENFHWFKKWNQVRSYNYNMDKDRIDISWFEGAKTNVCFNCVDRHLEIRPNKTAIIWEGNEPGEDNTVSYRDLHRQVC